jgi:hypothetical protein
MPFGAYFNDLEPICGHLTILHINELRSPENGQKEAKNDVLNLKNIASNGILVLSLLCRLCNQYCASAVSEMM